MRWGLWIAIRIQTRAGSAPRGDVTLIWEWFDRRVLFVSEGRRIVKLRSPSRSPLMLLGRCIRKIETYIQRCTSSSFPVPRPDFDGDATSGCASREDESQRGLDCVERQFREICTHTCSVGRDCGRKKPA
jgi:hypothetical protein